MKIRSRGTVYKSGDLSLVIVWTSLIFHYFFFFFLLLPLLLFPLLFHPSVRMVLEMDDFCRWSSRRWRGRIFRRYGKREVMQRIGVTGWARQSRVNKFVAFENLFFGRPVLINNNSESKIYKYIRWFSLLSTVKIATATRIPTMEGGGGEGLVLLSSSGQGKLRSRKRRATSDESASRRITEIEFIFLWI